MNRLIIPRGLWKYRKLIQTTACRVLVVSMELHHPLLQLASLIGGKAEIADIVGAVVLLVVVPQLSLHSVGAQEGVSDE